LPDEYDDDGDYDSYQLSPHERAYLINAHVERERQRKEQEEQEARRRALEEQKWQKELDQRQKEDEAPRKGLEEERERRRQLQVFQLLSDMQLDSDDPEQQQQKRAHSRDRSRSCHGRSSSPARTIPISTSDGRIPSPKPQTQDRPQPPLVPQYDEKHVEAASVLQRYFRIHQSIRAIKSVTVEFDTLRQSFAFPSVISFQKPYSSLGNDVINVAAVTPSSIAHDPDSKVKIPKLAFNSTNYDLHAYTEALDKLLVKLDGVESWGDPYVRTRRRGVVKQIEEEQASVDRFWRASWLKHIEQRGEWAEGDMPVDTEI
jgi:hypothetical protein